VLAQPTIEVESVLVNLLFSTNCEGIRRERTRRDATMNVAQIAREAANANLAVRKRANWW